MSDPFIFKSRTDFREWLVTNGTSSKGIWLQFFKTKKGTIKANEALEEAICFGWIDGLMKGIDETSYIKYFSIRRKNSNWSAKNKALAESLEKSGRMMAQGKLKIEEAKSNGHWYHASKPSAVSDEQIAFVSELLKVNEVALGNFQQMSPSIKKTYTRAYLDAKTPAGQTKRLAWLIARLEKNLKPM